MKVLEQTNKKMVRKETMRRMVSPGLKTIRSDLQKNYMSYLIVLPVLVWLILFCYKPMYGVIIAFQNYRPRLGFARSEWIGFENFARFFRDPFFLRTLRNTFSISMLSIIFSFPMPIILALLLNEVKNALFKRTVQTVTYLPHFVAMVISCALVVQFCQTNGVVNDVVAFFGGERKNYLLKNDTFYPVYILSGIWKECGWNSIIYLAALSGIDQEQYEAARLDGASRLQQIWHITLPGLLPTITMLLVLRLGQVMSVGYEKVLLLYHPGIYEVADVVSTYSFRKGFGGEGDASFSYGTAIGLFNSVVNIAMLLLSNKLSKKLGQSGLF